MLRIFAVVAPITFSLLYPNYNNAQSVSNYAVTRQTGITYTSIASTGSSVPSWRNNGAFSQDDNRSVFIDIGFDFWYDGTRYTQFSVSTNGFIDFSTSTDDGGPQADDFGYNNAAFTNANINLATRPAIAPFYDDMTAQGGTDPLGNSIKYEVSGTAPNRVLTVEWINMAVYLNTTPDLNFQIRLYETTGVIDFVYGTMTQGTHTFSYTCGINAPNVGNPPTAAQLKTQQVANTTNFTNTVQNNLSAMPANNSRITLTPPVPANPGSALNFSAVTQTSMTLNWTNWATNEVGYVVYNSTDGVNYYFVTQTAANATNVNVTGLWPSTTYYWRLYAVTEGALSTAVSGTQNTLVAINKVSNVAAGNWNTATTWLPNGVPTAADNVTIQNGHTVIINTDPVCNNLTIGQGTSGTLSIGNNNTARTLTINGNIVVAAGGNFSVNTASNTTHTLNFLGRINNNGILNFATDANSLCNVNFNRINSQAIQGSGAVNNYNGITLNIGSGATDRLNVTSVVFTAAADFLTLNSGTFNLQNTAATNLTFASGSGTFTVPGKTGILINNALATASFNGSVQLDGLLQLDAGTVNIGNAANENLNSNGGTLTINGGAMNVAGRYFNTNINTLSLFTISGGTLTAPVSGSTSTTIYPFHIDSPGATFTMSGGTIVIQNEGGTGAQNLGFSVTGTSSSSVTGGILQIGNASTAAGSVLRINSVVPVGGLLVNSVNATAQLQTNPLTVINDVNIALGSYNANNLNTTLGRNWIQNGTFTPGTGTVTFNNTAASQISSPATVTYNNLTVAGTATVTTNTNIITSGNFTINSGTFDVSAANRSLNVRRNWINNGSFNARQGLVTFDGTVLQNMSGTSATTFYDKRINNAMGVSITNGNYSLQNALTLSNGDFNITNANSYTLLSDAVNTAYIAPAAATATITGNATIQRFVSGRAAGYSDMSSPVTASTFADWDNELLLVYAYNPPSAYPSAYSYSETLWDYVPVTAATTALVPGTGYEVWLDSYGTWTTFDPTTINTVGNPFKGTLNLSASITNVNDGWNLVGNPYAAHLSWDVLFATTAQVSPTIMIYDEVIGDYETFSTGGGIEIAPHQGFWIQATGGAPSFSFTEPVKTTTNTSSFRNAKTEYFSLSVRKSNSPVNLSSNTRFRFDATASLKYNTEENDVSFKKVPHHLAPSLSSLSTDNTKLRVNSLPANDELIIPLFFEAGEEGLHTIVVSNIDFAQMQGYTCITLKDRKTGTETDLVSDGEYSFMAVSTDDKNRFVLKLSKTGDCSMKDQNNNIAFGNTADGVNIIYGFDSAYPSTVSISNLIGQQVFASKTVPSAGTYYLSTRHLAPGVYLVNVTVNGEQYTHKVVVD